MKILKMKDRSQITLNPNEEVIIDTMFSLPRKEWPETIVLSAGKFSKSSIADLINIEEEEYSNQATETMREYHINRKQFANLSPDDKVKETLDYFKVFWYALTGEKDITDEVKQKYETIAKKWFIENPTRSVISTKYLTNNLWKYKINYSNGNEPTIKDRLRKRVFDTLILGEGTDIISIKQDEEYYKNLKLKYD